MIFVDLIDCHIETDIVCGSIADVPVMIVSVFSHELHYGAAYPPSTKNQICFWEINGKRSVRNYVDDEKTCSLLYWSPRRCISARSVHMDGRLLEYLAN